MKTTVSTFHIEITDTFGGDANYSWKKEFLVVASSLRGAITKLAKSQGAGWLKEWDCGDTARYNLQGAAICAFVSYMPESALSQHNTVKYI